MLFAWSLPGSGPSASADVLFSDGFDNILLTDANGVPTPAAVPEPGTYALMALGLAGLGLVARRRKS